MLIRAARLSEANALRDIVERAYEVYIERIGRRPAPMGDDYAAKIKDGLVSVAVQGDDPIGLIVAIPCDDHLLVENLGYRARLQGRGVGRALLAHADRTAAVHGLAELRLYTNAAMIENLGLYPRLGYQEPGRRTDDGFDRVFFVKPTPPPS